MYHWKGVLIKGFSHLEKKITWEGRLYQNSFLLQND